MNKAMKTLSVVALLVAGAMTAANAAPLSDVVTGTADVVVGARDVTTFVTITPVKGTPAGPQSNGFVLATVKAGVTPGVMGIRFNSTAMAPISGANLEANTTGKSTGKVLKVYLKPDTFNYKRSVSDPTWYYIDAVTDINNGGIGLSGNQTLEVDAYPLSLDVAGWVE